MKAANAQEKSQVDIWQYVFGFTPMAVVKCAVELQIADVLESHGRAMSLLDLSSAIACSPSALHRIMRYLIHRGFFKLQESTNQYSQTPLSRLLLKYEANNIVALVLLESSPVMLAPWYRLSSRVSRRRSVGLHGGSRQGCVGISVTKSLPQQTHQRRYGVPRWPGCERDR